MEFQTRCGDDTYTEFRVRLFSGRQTLCEKGKEGYRSVTATLVKVRLNAEPVLQRANIEGDMTSALQRGSI